MPLSPARLLFVLVSLAGVACQPSSVPSERKPASPHPCTEMACMDSATITTKLGSADAPLGKHEFALELDGVAKSCTVEFSSETEIAQGECPEGVELYLGPAMGGKEMALDGVVAYTQEPIPGQFRWDLSFVGQPAEVHVVHTHAGRTIVDQQVSFQYSEHRPNGPDCEPVCHAASVDWTAG